MRNQSLLAAAAILCATRLFAAVPTAGLWAGEIVLDRVNEVTVGINAQNVPQAPDPLVGSPNIPKSATHPCAGDCNT